MLTARLLRPLGVLSQAARRLGEGDVAARAQVDGARRARAGRRRVQHDGRAPAALPREHARGAAGRAPLVAGGDRQSLGSRRRARHRRRDPAPERAAEALLELRADTGLERRTPRTARRARAGARRTCSAATGPIVPKGLEEAVRAATPEGERRLLPRGTPVYSEQGDVLGATDRAAGRDSAPVVRRAANDLVATVAHEFRTPLTSLRMAIHLLTSRPPAR